MTTTEFRKMALSFTEAVEASHMSHPDFRVGGKIFATLGYPDEEHGVLKLSPQEQQKMISEWPAAYSAAKGAWGRRGHTQVLLSAIDPDTLHSAMTLAWRNTAPRRLDGSR